MDVLIWAILLLLLALVLIILEMFIPSGGILAFLAISAVVASVVLAFALSGPVAGTVMTALTVILIPLVAAAAIRWWPHSPMGRLILNVRPGGRDEERPFLDLDQDPMQKLVGQRGRTKSKMLPSGAIVVGGRTYDAVSEGMPIDPNQEIEVIAVRGKHIVVRARREGAASGQTEDDVLSQPMDTLLPDPFQDPPA
jgi:membrane-bound ClpP family serine protease